MSNIEVKKVIVSHLTIKGDGQQDPFRRILEIFELDGTKIAERDPSTYSLNFNDILDLKKWIETSTNFDKEDFNKFLSRKKKMINRLHPNRHLIIICAAIVTIVNEVMKWI